MQANDDLRTTKMAAYLLAAGYSQKQIAASLTISQPTVSRLLSQARENGWIVTRCGLPPDELKQIEAEVFTKHELLSSLLATESEEHLRSIQVISTGGLNATYDVFAERAAQQLVSLLEQASVCGVAWGKTVASVARSISRQSGNGTRQSTPIQFFPVCGEPRDFPASDYSASASSQLLHHAVNAATGSPISLGGIAARIPKTFTKSEREVILKFIRSSTQYAKIFNNRNGLISKADCILTSGGNYKSRRQDDLWVADTIRSEKIKHADLSKVTDGDIGGTFIPTRETSPRQATKLSSMSSRWTGITIQDFRRCTNRARKSGKPGVVFVACGAFKADAVIAACHHKLINELIIDRDLAEEIVAILTT